MFSSHVCKKLVVVVWRIRFWWCWPNSNFIEKLCLFIFGNILLTWFGDLMISWCSQNQFQQSMPNSHICKVSAFVISTIYGDSMLQKMFFPNNADFCVTQHWFIYFWETGASRLLQHSFHGILGFLSFRTFDFSVFDIFDLSILSKFAVNGKCSYLMFVNFRFVWVWALHLRMVDLLMLLSPGSNEAFWFPRLVKCFSFF